MIKNLNRFFYDFYFKKITSDLYLSDGARIFYDSPYNFSRLTGFCFNNVDFKTQKDILYEVKMLRERAVEERKEKKKGRKKK